MAHMVARPMTVKSSMIAVTHYGIVSVTSRPSTRPEGVQVIFHTKLSILLILSSIALDNSVTLVILQSVANESSPGWNERVLR